MKRRIVRFDQQEEDTMHLRVLSNTERGIHDIQRAFWAPNSMNLYQALTDAHQAGRLFACGKFFDDPTQLAAPAQFVVYGRELQYRENVRDVKSTRLTLAQAALVVLYSVMGQRGNADGMFLTHMPGNYLLVEDRVLRVFWNSGSGRWDVDDSHAMNTMLVPAKSRLFSRL